MGGAVCASKVFSDALVNFARAYLFSTAIPPAMAAAAQAAIEVVNHEPHRQSRLRKISREFRAALTLLGIAMPAGDSPIIPIILGNEKSAVDAADSLSDMGLLVMAVRPPTVPKGSSRLRITLSSQHTDQEIERLLEGLGRLAQSLPVRPAGAES
jgi:8-amino-7-oxononanoate synthase